MPPLPGRAIEPRLPGLAYRLNGPIFLAIAIAVLL